MLFYMEGLEFRYDQICHENVMHMYNIRLRTKGLYSIDSQNGRA